MLTTPEPWGAVAPVQPATPVSCSPGVTAKAARTEESLPPEPPESLLAAPPPPPPGPPLAVTVTELASAGTLVVAWMLQAWESVQLDTSVSTWGPKENWSAATGRSRPVGVSTLTSTVPVPAGEVAVIEPVESAVMVPGAEPKSTAVASEVGPGDRHAGAAADGPVAGLTPVTVGGGTERGVGELVGRRRRRGAVGTGDRHVDGPGVPDGAVAVIDVAESAVMAVGFEPKSTAVAPLRLVPEMVTLVPPEGGPLFRAHPRHRGLATRGGGDGGAGLGDRRRVGRVVARRARRARGVAVEGQSADDLNRQDGDELGEQHRDHGAHVPLAVNWAVTVGKNSCPHRDGHGQVGLDVGVDRLVVAAGDLAVQASATAAVQ